MSVITDDLFIGIPRRFKPDWKVELVKDGVAEDVTDDVIYGKFTLLATEGISDFEIQLNDSQQTYQKYIGTETVRIYIDNDTLATTKRFEGTIEKIKNQITDTLQVTFSGRHISKELLNTLVSKSYTDTEVSAILIDLISTYLTRYTTESVTASSVTTSADFADQPFWDCVKSLCEIANFDCYVDDSKTFHFFERNSILNNDEGIYEYELINLSGLGDTMLDIKNRVRVYGQDSSGMPIVWTADDINSQNQYGILEAFPISDTSIQTVEGAKKRAEGELALQMNKRLQGTVIVYGLPSIRAGEKIWISLPEQSIHDKYRVLSVLQEFGTNIDVGFKSTLTIEKPVRDLSLLMRDMNVNISGKDTSKSQNPNQLKYSYNNPFDDQTGLILSNTVLSNGSLILSSGFDTGTAESIAVDTASNVGQVELKVSGNALDTSVFQVSTDGGYTYENISINALKTLSNAGNRLVLKITLNVSGTTNPEIYGASLLFS